MTWLWIVLGVYLLALVVIVRVLCKAADLNLGFVGSGLLVVFGPVVFVVIVSLFFLGIIGEHKKSKREEKVDEDLKDRLDSELEDRE